MNRTTIGEMMQAKANVEAVTGKQVDCIPRTAVSGWCVAIGGVAQDLAQDVTLKEAVYYLRAYYAGYVDNPA
jgi:hypothetical protein